MRQLSRVSLWSLRIQPVRPSITASSEAGRIGRKRPSNLVELWLRWKLEVADMAKRHFDDRVVKDEGALCSQEDKIRYGTTIYLSKWMHSVGLKIGPLSVALSGEE